MTKSIFADEKIAAKLVAAYQASNHDNEKLGDIAKQFGATVPAVRGKLVAMGEYVKPVKAATVKTGVSVKQKADIVKAVEIMLSLREGSLASLEKGSKADLQLLADSLIKEGDKA